MENDGPLARNPYSWVPHLLRGTVIIRDRRILIRDPLESAPGDARDPGGLVTVAANAVVIWSRVDTGVAHLRVNFGFERLRAPTTNWAAREEVEFVSTTGALKIDDLLPIGHPGDHGYPLNLAFIGPGRYGLLVHGRSRRLPPSAAAKEVGESYMLFIWPLDPHVVASMKPGDRPRR